MTTYIDTLANAQADWEAAYAAIMTRPAGEARAIVMEDARNAYGERIARAFDAENMAGAFPGYAGRNVYDTDAATYGFADPANGYQHGTSAFPVYRDGVRLIVQELGSDGRLHPVARVAPAYA
jgi:hypothetical protein